jgi:hypothetical protein
MEDRLRAASFRSGDAAAVAVPDLPTLDAERARERRFLALAVARLDRAGEVLAQVPEEAMSEPVHREALRLLKEGEAPEGWPEHLQGLGAALRMDPGTERATQAELQEAGYRVQIPVLQRRAARMRETGDEEGRLRVLDLERRLRAALRGGE